MQDPKYVINLVELQNINTSSSGENGVQDLQNMVNFQNKTVSTDFLNSYSGGSITVGNPLVLSDNITVGGTIITTSSGAGSSGLTVSGISGISAVYDTLYNPPVVGLGTKLSAAPYTGGTVAGDGFTLTRSGLFYMQLVVTIGADASALPPGGYITGGLFADGVTVVGGSQQTVVGSTLVIPGSGVLTWTYGSICTLGTAATYTYQIGSVGSWNLGTSGSVVASVFRLS